MRVSHLTLPNRLRGIAAAAAAILIAAASPAVAQPNKSNTSGGAAPSSTAQSGASQNNALQGFSQNRNQPVQIEAASLEVRDKEKKATFAGNVKVVQGDTTMRCKSLVVFYEQQGQQGQQPGAQTMKAAAPGPGGSSSISRLEATGGVTVTQKDQVATGETAVFDMKTNTVTLQGKVVVSQGRSVMRGDRLVVNLTTGVSRVEGSGPVSVLFDNGGSGQDNKDGKDNKGGSGLGGFGGLGGGKFGPSLGGQRQNSAN